MLSFDEWVEENEEELIILFAENGADREMDFDFEEESYRLYEQYCNRERNASLSWKLVHALGDKRRCLN